MEPLLARARRRLWPCVLVIAFLPAVGLAGDRPTSFGNATLTGAIPEVAVEGWPMFRGNAARTGEIQDAGTSNGASSWIYATGGPVRSSPAVAGGLVIFGSDDGNIYAVDSFTGGLVWQYQTGGPVVSSPAVADDSVFIGGPFGFYQIPAGGGKVTMLYGGDAVDSSPAVEAGWVYFVTRGGILKGIRYATGEEWEQSLSKPTSSVSSPAVANGKVYVFSGNQLVIVPAEGGEPSTYPLPAGGAGDATPAIYGETVYFIGVADQKVYAISPQGTPVCTFRESIDPALPGSSPAVTSTGIFYLTPDYNLYVAPLDLWTDCAKLGPDVKEPIPSTRAPSPATTGSTGYAGSDVYTGTPDGKLYVWHFAFDLSVNEIESFAIDRPGGAIDSSPALAYGFVYIGCADGNLYAFTT
jgi:outer membrane protein assembly factor BamB